jgi:hypothetical protein
LSSRRRRKYSRYSWHCYKWHSVYSCMARIWWCYKFSGTSTASLERT